LNNAQGCIILSLRQNDNITVTELARRTAFGKTTLTSLLDRLEHSGHIIGKTDSADKRTVRVALSGKSKSLESLYGAASAETTALFYQGFSEEQVDKFESYLKRILSNLVEYEQKHK